MMTLVSPWNPKPVMLTDAASIIDISSEADDGAPCLTPESIAAAVDENDTPDPATPSTGEGASAKGDVDTTADEDTSDEDADMGVGKSDWRKAEQQRLATHVKQKARLGAESLKDILENYVCKDDPKRVIYLTEQSGGGNEVMRVPLQTLLEMIDSNIDAEVKQFFIPICLQNGQAIRSVSSLGGHFTCVYVDVDAGIIEYYDPHYSAAEHLLHTHWPQWMSGVMAKPAIRRTQFMGASGDAGRMDFSELINAVKQHILTRCGKALTVASNTTRLQQDDYNCGRFMTDYILHRREADSLATYTQHLGDALNTTGYDKFFEELNDTITNTILTETP